VVIGEPQRAFYGNQFSLTFPVFTHFGVQLWVPEVGGCIDPGSEAHDLVMTLFGGMSKGERTRVKAQVEAVAAGRYVGPVGVGAGAWRTPKPSPDSPWSCAR
jgi:site-specific DNA recombinase